MRLQTTREAAMASGKVLAFPGVRVAEEAAVRGGVPDAAARAEALDVARSWIVEAPAGSGKTGLLVQRMLKLLADASVTQPEEVLAITFTRKATAELRERVVAQLRAAQDGAADGLSAFDAASHALAADVMARDAAAGWGLLAQPQRLNIRTIDAVCADIAGTLPLLSGAGGAGAPTDAPEPLYRVAAQRTLLQLGGSNALLDEALRTVLLHRDGNLQDCETLLARMLAQREQWAELVPLGQALDEATLEAEVRPKLEKSLELIVCAGLTRAAQAMPADMMQGLTRLAARLAHNPGYRGAVSPIAICANRSEPPEERAAHLELWTAMIHLLVTAGELWRSGFAKNHLGFEIDKADVQLLKEIIDPVRENEVLREALCDVRALPPAHYPEEQWVAAKALFRMLVRGLAELKVLFAERGTCDFAEMSIAAKTALRADEGEADFAGAAGLQHLLVDEMQDTSASQYELIELLTRSWDGRSQTLFLVGDPKQSIYLFRQARVERFLRTIREEKMGDVPLGVLRLTANFRSQAGLVEDGFNADFGLIFPAPGTRDGDQADPMALDVPFVRAASVRPRSVSAEGRLWHAAVLGESENDGEGKEPRVVRAKAEAAAMRAIVETWRARPLPEGRKLGVDGAPLPWRIAVLARAREHLSPVIAEFRRTDVGTGAIAYRAVEIERLGEQAEVIDLLALTRALLHPADRVAWLAVLHAPWCGLGLRDLLAIAGGGADAARKEPLALTMESRRMLLSTAGRELFDRAWPALRAAWAMRGRTSVAVHVERAWISLGGDAALGGEQRQNAELYFEALRAVEEAGGRVDLQQLAERVGRMYAKPANTAGAVELLTTHGAKGLEWDVVLVPAMERKSPAPRAELLNWLAVDFGGDEAAHTVLAPIHGRGEDASALYKWLCKVRSDREAAERKRLFYVTCTRAREELHLFAAVKRDAKGQLCQEKTSLLRAAWPAAEAEFAALAAVPAVGGNLRAMLQQSAAVEDDAEESGLAIAASGVVAAEAGRRPTIARLPLSFSAAARTAEHAARKLAYVPASALRRAANFERPEGSFEVRAFGNVVHRYLERLAEELRAKDDVAALATAVAGWTPRLLASLRNEGLRPSLLPRMAERGVLALTNTLADATGQWLLRPHAGAQSEVALQGATGVLRVDRTFVAGAEAGREGESHVWIVDFKTSEPSSLQPAAFEATEKAKYGAQLAAYAEAFAGDSGAADAGNSGAAAGGGVAQRAVMLGLYYPLAARLVAWPYEQCVTGADVH